MQVKQNKLTQKRIDLLFANRDSDQEEEISFKVQNKQGHQGEVVQRSVNSPGSLLGGGLQPEKVLNATSKGVPTKPMTEVEVLTSEEDQLVTANSNLIGYGSDFDSPPLQHKRAGTNTISSAQRVENSSMMGDSSQKDPNAPASLSDIKVLLDQLKNDIIQDQDMKRQKMETELSTTKLQLKLCQVQLNEVIGITIRQDQEIRNASSN